MSGMAKNEADKKDDSHQSVRSTPQERALYQVPPPPPVPAPQLEVLMPPRPSRYSCTAVQRTGSGTSSSGCRWCGRRKGRGVQDVDVLKISKDRAGVVGPSSARGSPPTPKRGTHAVLKPDRPYSVVNTEPCEGCGPRGYPGERVPELTLCCWVHDSQYLVEGAAEREVIPVGVGCTCNANRRPEDFHVVDPPRRRVSGALAPRAMVRIPLLPQATRGGRCPPRCTPPAYRDGSAGGRGYGSPAPAGPAPPRGRRGGPGGAPRRPPARERAGRTALPFDPGACSLSRSSAPPQMESGMLYRTCPPCLRHYPEGPSGPIATSTRCPRWRPRLAARPPVGQVVDPRMGGAPGLPGRPLPLDPADANLEGEEEEASDSTATESDSPGRKAGARASLPHWHQWGSQASLASMGSAGGDPERVLWTGGTVVTGMTYCTRPHYGGAFRNGPRS
eukprot:jgi/Botrbrau1/12692/Bobra.67_1s0056.1